MDFELPQGEESCWVTVGPWSVYIRKTDEGIVVELYAVGKETGLSFESCQGLDEWVLDDELLEE